MKTSFFLLLATTLFATVNKPLTISWQTGYRNDRIHWHLQDPGEPGYTTYSELYRDVEFWENGLVFQWIYRDLSFNFRGNYGTFGRGDLFQSYPNQPKITFHTKGWSADALGTFGYAVNLTEGRTYKMILTPLIGYLGLFEELKRFGGNALSSLPGDFRFVWNGVFLGGTFSFEPNGPLWFKAGYQFNFLHNRIHTNIKNGFTGTEIVQSIRESSGGNGGHTGTLEIDWSIHPKLRMGIYGLINYFSTRVVDATIRESGRGNQSQKLKLRWTVIKGALQISRQF